MTLRRRTSGYEIDMTSGNILLKLCRFAFPLALSSIIQLLFNAADVVVIGNYSGNTALAAVGSTGALTNLIINLFIGLSVGTNVLVARAFASKNLKDVHDYVHTSILTSLIAGCILIVFGVVLSYPMLRIMDCPEDVIDQAVLYMRIYFLGMPFNMLYNFGAAVLRSVGDTKRPLYFLIISGIINVILNLIFVIDFHMDVAGVAFATIISQAVSAVLVLLCLLRSDASYKLILKELKISLPHLLQIAKIGLPAGMQGALFSISNIMIQSSINSFGSTVMAGSTAASNIEGFVYVSMNAFHQACLSFTSQNMGAQRYDRVRKILYQSLLLVTVVGLVFGVGAYLLGTPLLSIYTSDPEVIEAGLIRLFCVCSTYFLCGIMDVLVGGLRGIGASLTPMIVSIAGVCGFRILWIYTLFQWNHDIYTLYLSYPASWILTSLLHFICYLLIYHKMIKRVHSNNNN